MYNTDGYDQWIKAANRNFAGPLTDIFRAGTEILQRVSQENLDMASENLLRLSDQLIRFKQVKKPEDFINTLRECVNEDVNATIQNSQKLMHATITHLEEAMKSCGTLHESAIKTAASAVHAAKEHGKEKR